MKFSDPDYLSEEEVAKMARAAFAEGEKSAVETAIRLYHLGKQHGHEHMARLRRTRA